MTALVLFLSLGVDDASACAMPYERAVVARVVKAPDGKDVAEAPAAAATSLADVLADIDAAAAPKAAQPAPRAVVIAEASGPTS